MMRKTSYKAYITHHDGNRNYKAVRRVWEDSQHKQRVMIYGTWMPVERYKISPHHDIKLQWEPCGR